MGKPLSLKIFNTWKCALSNLRQFQDWPLWAGCWTQWPPKVLFKQNLSWYFNNKLPQELKAKQDRHTQPHNIMSIHGSLQCSTYSSQPNSNSSINLIRSFFRAVPMSTEKTGSSPHFWNEAVQIKLLSLQFVSHFPSSIRIILQWKSRKLFWLVFT